MSKEILKDKTMKKILISILIFSLFFFLVTKLNNVRGFGIYQVGTTGYDISFPQCGSQFPSLPYAFGIVGVNKGRTFSQNPCLSSEYQWAVQATNSLPSLYINLSYPIGSTASEGLSGPKGNCSRKDKACQAYNYGFNAAEYSYNYASSQNALATMWWIDIETANSWSSNTGLNDLVIQGATEFLQSKANTVGYYSTKYQWNKIAGTGYNPGLPNWVAGASSLSAAPSFCSSNYSFGGGTPWLVQYPNGSYSGNYACP